MGKNIYCSPLVLYWIILVLEYKVYNSILNTLHSLIYQKCLKMT